MAQYPQQPNPWQPVQPDAQQQQAYGQQQYAAAAPNPWVPVQQAQQAQQHFYMPEVGGPAVCSGWPAGASAAQCPGTEQRSACTTPPHCKC